jgi:hypothetical protein
MKIGILTLPLHTNYGGILQAYALQAVLKNMEHEVVLIKENEIFKLPLWKAPISYAKRFLFKYILKRKGAIDIFYEQYFKKITQNTRPFIDEYIQELDIEDVKKDKESFDAIVVGSDQIWRPKYYYKNITKAYLSFAKSWNIKRIAYAASFGTDKWEYTEAQTQQCRNLVEKFDAVSVREKSGIDLCQRHFGINAVQVLDPTMLLDVQHYISLIERANIEKSKGELFVYVLDKSKETHDIEQEICSMFGYKPFYSSTDSSKASLENKIASRPEVWLRSFYDAEFILTDSFHACVFSILFNKPFVVYGNKNRGLSRFDSLLQLFGLEQRLISQETVHLQQTLNTPIDWTTVNAILREQRDVANRFLIDSFSKL